MDKTEIHRSSGGASKAAPPTSVPVHIQVSWSRAARRAPLSTEPDAAANAAETRKTRTALHRATKHAVQEALRQVPLKINTSALQDISPAMEVDLSFVSDAEIAALNGDYRGRPRPTDVLSFSQWEDEEMLPLMMLEQAGESAHGSTPVPLGDIIISIETAQRQAKELKHDLLTEVMFLAVHGTLHLCGYDHGTAPQRRVMWKLQEKIVASLAPASA